MSDAEQVKEELEREFSGIEKEIVDLIGTNYTSEMTSDQYNADVMVVLICHKLCHEQFVQQSLTQYQLKLSFQVA